MEARLKRVTTAASVKGLYLLEDTSVQSHKTFLYYLRALSGSKDPNDPPASMAVKSSWKGPANQNQSDAPGWYVFVDEEIGNKADFERAVHAKLPPVFRLGNGFTRRCISWIPNVNKWIRDWAAGEKVESPRCMALVQHSWGLPTSRSVVSPGPRFTWSDSIGLGLPGGSRVDLLEDGVPRFEIAAGRLDLRNSIGALTGAYPPEGGARLAVPLTSEQAGGFAFRVRWDPAALREHYGCDFRYVLEGEGSRQSLRYPLLPPAARPSDLNRSWGCDMWLHPFHHEDADCTRLALDLERGDDAAQRSRDLLVPYFLSTSGNVVALRPKQTAPVPSGEGAEEPEKRRGPKVTLDPESPGFALVKAPVAGDDREAWQFAMAPVGRFVVQAAAGAAAGAAQHLMCGLSGTEYLVLEPDNEIEFVPGKPAVATGLRAGPSGGSEAARPRLAANHFTTSWARVHRNGAGSDGAKGVVPSYCAQPSTASYFAKRTNPSPADYPVAVGISLKQLGDAASPPFPLVPYGGVFGGSNKGTVNPNPAFDADTVAAFEKQVVEPRRREELVPGAKSRDARGRDEADDLTGPGPVFFDAAANTPFEGGAARTAMGLIAQLNPRAGETNGKPPGPAGSWRRLKLAQSPQKLLEQNAGNLGAQYLELTPNAHGVVNPRFSYAALRDELFMVVTDPGLLWPPPASGEARQDSANKILLGDFLFKVDVGAFDADNDKNTPTALVVFKFTPGISFEALVNDPTLWTTFLGKGDVAAHASPVPPPKEPPKSVQERIQRYLKAAHDDDTGLYDAFNSIIADPNWSGMLVFNCPLAYEDLPPDIQILLGGIDGALRAHHFGVTINRVKEEAAREISIRDSSLFAVIDYNKDFAPPRRMRLHPEDYPKFQVLNFNVEYANSKLVVFKSTIAFSLSTLCGNPVTLSKWKRATPLADHPSTGTIVIEGVYTLHEDGTGSLVFSTDEERVFMSTGRGLKLRVLEGFRVDDATLVPVETKVLEDGSRNAIAAFRLDGTMAFKDIKDLFADAGDLFSYGELTDAGPGWRQRPTLVPSKGLVINDYGFAMTTHIRRNPKPGEPPASLQPIKHDLSVLKVDQELSESRSDSFEQSFPSKIETFRYVEAGQGTGLAGAWQVKIKDKDDFLEHTDPHFMLQFKIPLGSLGGLVSSTNNLVADLHIGWKPGAGPKAADELGVVLVLPAMVAGADGFNIQGIVPSAFDAVCLDRHTFESSTNAGSSVYPYCLRFENYCSRLLGIPLSYFDAPTDLGIFGAPKDPGGDHSAWFVGASVAKPEDLEFGVTIELPLPKLPEVFIGRSFAIDTDPTDPKVIDEAISDLNALSQWTVAQYMQYLYAHDSRFSSAAGMTFALKFEFAALTFSMLFHDNDFYGAKIKFEPPSPDEDEEKKDPAGPDPVLKRQKASRNLLADAESEPPKPPPPLVRQKTSHQNVHKAPDPPKKKKGLDKLGGFEFSIIYRKISEHIGVWSSTIFIDVGDIEVGAATVTLPDFSISIWTNGDWRLAVGWPLDDHPITVQFQAGPIPVIGKLGFYLAKLNSEAAPSKFLIEPAKPGKPLRCPPNFDLIWAFGLGLSAGIGKEWEKGPFSASASLSLVLTVEGFLASFEGNISEDGVDYVWVCASLAVVGHVEGAVDFKIISASLSITLTLKLAIAVESLHSTALALTFEATVEASIKIVFVRIHFSFSKTLTIWETTLGDGPPAEMDGPSFPPQVKAKFPGVRKSVGAAGVWEDRSNLPLLAARDGASGGSQGETRVAEKGRKRTIEVKFLLQSTAVPADAQGTTWEPRGVATLVLESGKRTSPFGKLTQGLAEWLLHEWGGQEASFGAWLDNVEADLKGATPAFGKEAVDRCLAEMFVFKIVSFPSEKPKEGDPIPPVAVIPVHPSLELEYEDQPNLAFGERKVPVGYADQVQVYFEPERAKPEGKIDGAIGDDSVASLVFTEYFVMFAKQLVTDLQKEVEENEAADLVTALKKDGEEGRKKTVKTDVVKNVAGFVSRFLMGGVRLPKPKQGDAPAGEPKLAGLYALTGQQFPLTEKVLQARLVKGAQTPAWLHLDGGVTAQLDPGLVYDVELPKPPWEVKPIPALSPVSARFPMNASWEWAFQEPGTKEKKDLTAYRFSDGLRLAIQRWRNEHKDDSRKSVSGPWLKLEQENPDNRGGGQGEKEAYAATPVLLLPLVLKTIPKPAEPGGKPGVLKDTYSLVGTDEVHRAYLQALLNDERAIVTSLDFAVNADQGKYKSTKKAPKVLVRSNLSTSTGGAEASIVGAAAKPADPDPDLGPNPSPNHANPAGDAGEKRKFLRLVWECSIVHTGGFYLQLEALAPGLFKNGEASLLLVVATRDSAEPAVDVSTAEEGAEADRGQLVPQLENAREPVKTEPYHNALIGEPCPGSAVIAGLENSAGGDDPVLTYAASYSGGSAGWSIDWKNAPTCHDALDKDKKAALQGLYQTVSYRVTRIGGEPKRTNWSRPVTAVHEARAWRYQKAFLTAPLLGEQNTYAAIGKSVEVEISIEDFFGNSVLLATRPTLPVVYNDNIFGLANWSGTQTDYAVDRVKAKPDKVELTVNFSYGSLLFTLGDVPDPLGLLRKLLDEAGDSGGPWAGNWDLSPDEARKELESEAPDTEQLRVVLVDGLNKLIRGGSIYKTDRFRGVKLPEQAKKLKEKKPTGNLLILLNRILLEARYRALIGAEAAEKFEQKSKAEREAARRSAAGEPDETPDDAARRIVEERRQKALALEGVLKQYRQIYDQLADDRLSAAIDTNRLLAAEPLFDPLPDSGAAKAKPAAEHLRRFVDSIVEYLKEQVDWLRDPAKKPPESRPEPLSLRFELDKGYPKGAHWGGVPAGTPGADPGGDLRELRVSLLLQRAGVDGQIAVVDRGTGKPSLRNIAELAPEVKEVRSPITPVPGKSTAEDPTGLEAFAFRFERAYQGFDGKPDGVIKVATGVNSDFESSRFGMPSLWLARWGKSGITVDIDTEKDKPVYYAPPPLSTQVITRSVKGLTTYKWDKTDPEKFPREEIATKVFSAIDIDRLAASFLSSVENIFSPEIAPQVAKLSKPEVELYDPYVVNKARLAKEIAETLTQVYESQLTDRDDPALRSAMSTMKQALLNTLENDYGVSTLIQLLATIKLHGAIEPGGGEPPPNLFGNITPTVATRVAEGKPIPYNFSPAKLPLHDGKAWLNFLLSMQNPAAQSVLDVKLAYQMGFIEHNIDSEQERYGYTPSSWLTFVRQLDNYPPDDETNTLTGSIGELKIPIPLRTYPPLPRLISAKATQDTPAKEIQEIQQALVWTYSLEVALPAAHQDTLSLMVTFNEAPAESKEPAEPEAPSTSPQATAKPSARLPASDLFEGLARYSHEYPQLEGPIQRLAKGESDEKTRPALQHLSRLVTDVAGKWGEWQGPKRVAESPGSDPADADWRHHFGADREVWHYRIGHAKGGTLTLSVSANCPTVHWPIIDGYSRLPDPPDTAAPADGPAQSLVKKVTYEPEPAESTDEAKPTGPKRLRLSWGRLYVLDYQSARASAFVERNRNLGGEAERTNPVFVYQTETVSMPSSVVPLIKVPETLKAPPEYVLEPGDSLQAGVATMLREMFKVPEKSIASAGADRKLKLEGPISYSFRSLTDGTAGVRSFLPLCLMHSDVGPGEGEDERAAEQVAHNVRRWRNTALPSSTEGAISFRLTIFATRIVKGDLAGRHRAGAPVEEIGPEAPRPLEQLPLVQFQDLSLETRDAGDDELWWGEITLTG